jgi:hypothetical protein
LSVDTAHKNKIIYRIIIIIIFWQWIKGGVRNETRQNSTESREWKPDKFNTQLLQDESIKMLYLQRMNKEIDINYYGNTEEMYVYIVNTVKKISYEVLGKESRKIRRNGWINKDILGGINEKRNVYQKWLSSSKEEDKNRYEEKKHEVRKEVRRAKNERWEKVCADINSKLGFTKLYRKIIQGGKIPEEMKLGYISSIHKKGDRRSCSNYRGICVINPIMKAFGRLIKHRLEEDYVSSEEQCGFTTGRSCIDHIFTLRQILEKCQEKTKQIGIVYIDIEKAYDSVPRKLLWQALEQASISEHIIDILKSMYSSNRCQVKVRSRLSREFYTSKGLLQGCCTSPAIF